MGRTLVKFALLVATQTTFVQALLPRLVNGVIPPEHMGEMMLYMNTAMVGTVFLVVLGLRKKGYIS